MSDTFERFLQTGVVPDHPHRGLYPQWDKNWNPTGYAETPHHKGQPATRFPIDWLPGWCFLAGDCPGEWEMQDA